MTPIAMYVLILLYTNGGVVTQEFNSEENCKLAGKTFKEKDRWNSTIIWSCTPK
jgi:hypothetical protein